MALSDWAYSRILGAGALHGLLNRRSMCPFTWVPSPSSKRPSESRWMSQAA